MMTDSAKTYVSWFTDIGLADRPIVGGKGASLGELTGAGIRVPPGCVVTTSAFERFLGDIDPKGDIRASVAALPADALDSIAETGKQIAARILSAGMPTDVADAIRQAYSALGNDQPDAPVAVRSSATSEDSEEASFAGLQETYLWIRGADDVIRHVQECWASLYSSESISYRRRLGLPENELGMGVVVQEMVNSQASGVMFTRSPTTGDRSVVTIEASWGLGSSIVSGEVTPDRFVVNKVTGEITGRDISGKLIRHVPDFNAGGISIEDIAEDLQTAPAITDAQIAELVETGKRIERHYGSPQDIEWAIAEDGTGSIQTYLLQSRPETVWAAKEGNPIAAPKKKAFGHVFSALSGGRV